MRPMIAPTDPDAQRRQGAGDDSSPAPGRHGLALVLLVALALRLIRLGAPSFWIDEGASLLFAGDTWTALWQSRAVDPTPLLFPALLKLWMMMVPAGSELWLRLLPALLGLAGVGLACHAGRCVLGSDRAGLVTGLAVALSPFHVRYSQELRGYSLWFACLTGALIAVRKLGDRPSPGAALGLAGWLALAMGSHHATVFYLPALALLGWLWTGKDRRFRAAAGGAIALAAILSAPSIFHMFQNIKVMRDGFWVPPMDAGLLARAALSLVAPLPGLSTPVTATVAISFLIGLPALAQLTGRDARPIALTLVPLGALTAWSCAVQPILIARTLLPGLLGLALVVAALAGRGDGRRARFVNLGLVGFFAFQGAGLLVYHLHPEGGGRVRADWRGGCQLVLEGWQDGDRAVFAPDWIKTPFLWYQARAGRALPLWGFPRPSDPARDVLYRQPVRVAPELPGFWAGLVGARRIWLFTSQLDDPQGLLLASARARGQLEAHWSLGDVELWRFSLTPPERGP